MNVRLRVRFTPVCAAVLAACATAAPSPYVRNVGSADGYAIRYVRSSPRPGTTLDPGRKVTLSMTVAYDLSIADSGAVALVLQRETSAQLIRGREQVMRVVRRGSGRVTLTDEFVVPRGIRTVKLFVPLMPAGQRGAGGELLIDFPVRRPPPEARASATDSALCVSRTQLFERFVTAMEPDSVAALFLPDGELIEGTRIIARSPDGIRDAYRGLLRQARFAHYALVIADVSLFEGMVLVTGDMDEELVGLGGGPSRQFTSHFQVEWRPGSDGEWRLSRMSSYR